MQADPQQLEVIEEFALGFEVHGMPRMAGRILGRLLMCHPPQQSMSQLAEALGASKGSVSSMTRLLIQRGVVERFTVPGDRQDYFRIRAGSVSDMFREHLRSITHQLALLQKAIAVADDRTEEGLARLHDAQDFLEFLRREIPGLLAKWDRSRAQDPEAPFADDQHSPHTKEDE